MSTQKKTFPSIEENRQQSQKQMTDSSSDMDRYIHIVNKIQSYNTDYKCGDIQIPEIVVVGSQSSGKSSVLERIISKDILPKDNKLATRRPIILQMTNALGVSDISAVINGETITSTEKLKEQLMKLNNGNDEKKISEEAIIVQLSGSLLPTLTLVDVPGMISHDVDIGEGSKEQIMKINENYARSEYSIILAVSAANNDLATSEAINLSNKHDPHGQRTIHVLTKLDMMNKGDKIGQQLDNPCLKKGLATICVVNRNTEKLQNKQPLSDTKKDEQNILKDNFGNDHKAHGIDALIGTLSKTLLKQIRTHCPEMKRKIDQRREEIKDKIDQMSAHTSNCRRLVERFKKEFEDLVRGNSEFCISRKPVGGVLISYELYTTFEKNIENIKVQFELDEVKQSLQNLRGSQKFSFSIENSFKQFSKREIRKLERPSLESLDKCRRILSQLVVDTIAQINEETYAKVLKRIEGIVNSFIEEQNKKSMAAIKDWIRCEINDVFCEHPNISCDKSIKGRIETKKEEKRKEQWGSIVDGVVAAISVVQPQTALVLKVAYETNCFKALKSMKWDDISLSPLFDKLKERFGDAKSMPSYLEEIPNFSEIVSGCQAKFQEKEKENIDSDIVVDLVEKYFEEVKKNVIYCVAKFIQTFLVYDLIDKLPTLSDMMEDEKDTIFAETPEMKARQEQLLNESKKLDDIAKGIENLT